MPPRLADTLLALAAVCLLGLGLPACRAEMAAEPAVDASPAPDPRQLAPSHPDCFGPAPVNQRLVFGAGDTMDGLLRRADLDADERQALIEAFSTVHDAGSFRSGRALILHRDGEGRALGLDYALDYLRDLCARRSGDGFRADIFEADLPWRTRALSVGLEPSFYEALAAQGVSGDLATRVADLFAGEIDFFLDLRPGDRMEILVETADRPDREGPRVRVLAARMVLDGEASSAYLFADETGTRHYYHADGSSLERQFLKAPLNYSRISSGFSGRRLHPILGVHRPHYGVDYAAPTGTPILATADGTVRQRSRSNGAGRFIKLRHPGNIETTYMHLSRFANGTAQGRRVSKGQVIGYVGSSGLSTGPHLDYRIKVGGSYVDPRRFRSEPAAPLPTERREEFRATVAAQDSLWSLPVAAAAELAQLLRQSPDETSSE
jgi:murein DD-endopeptidase MepM/ murein hydrolase activator NlpD